MRDRNNIISTLVLGAILVLCLVFIPETIGLGATGFDTQSILQQFFFYVAPGVGFLLGILLLKGFEEITTKDDNKYGSGLAFNNTKSPPSLFNLRLFRSKTLVALASLIAGSILALISLNTAQQTFTGVKILQEQFTEASNLLFSSALAPASENLGLAFILAFGIFTLRRIARKRNMSKWQFTILCIGLLTFIGGLYGLTNHLLRYGGSDLSLTVVFMFWSVGALVTLVTGSFIPFWMMHITNNVFFDLSHFFSSDIVYGVVIGIIISLGILFGVLWKFTNLGKKVEN